MQYSQLKITPNSLSTLSSDALVTETISDSVFDKQKDLAFIAQLQTIFR